ncbi:37 kDa salivary gland allergen Aed a 2-like [Anopheles coustani]|nr:37 kDa salivary gland allergen Aed a 2-like [Anopheles coustani]
MQRVVQLEPVLFLLLLISSVHGDHQLETQNEHNVHSAGTDGGSVALSPDDTLFAHLRCFERFASKQSGDREQDVTDWLGTSQRYLHRTDRAPDFVKCVLEKVGFYDPREGTFMPRVLEEQFKEYRKWMSLDEESVQLFVNETQSSDLVNNSSDEVYEAFETLFSNHSNAYFQLFLRDPSVLQNLYDQKEFAVRKPNQTVIEFCELQMGEDLWNDICHIRAYEISNQTDAMEAHISCVFRGFRYLTAEGLINEVEIIQDFAKAAVSTDTSEAHIMECVNDLLQEQVVNKRALRMYACLLHSGSKELFKEAFDFREVRSGNLSYLLQNLPYNRDQVKHQILALDKERCDDQQRPTGRILRY